MNDLLDAFDIDADNDAHWKVAVDCAAALGFDTLSVGVKDVVTRRPVWHRSTMGASAQDYISKTYFGFGGPTADSLFAGLDPLTIRFGEVLENANSDTRYYKWDQDHKKRLGFDVGHWFFFDVSPTQRLGVGFIRDSGHPMGDDPSVFPKLRALAQVLSTNIGGAEPQESAGRMLPMSSPLSPREKEVLTLLAGGFLSYEIARELSLADVTVKKHISRAKKRLGCATREQAVAVAMQNGLLKPR